MAHFEKVRSWLSIGCLVGLVACGRTNLLGDTDLSGTGGVGTGGSTLTGGSALTGGFMQTGGSALTGGSMQTGGSMRTGGSVQTGGSVRTGGSALTGGSMRTGGSVQTGGEPGTGGRLPDAVCGDGKVDTGENCDGNDLQTRDCKDYGFGGGTLSCTANCDVDLSACDTCGNGVLESDERCDGKSLGGQSCRSIGYSGGPLACTSECAFNTDGCAWCGNGMVESGENCEGAEMGGATCDSLGLGTGVVQCDASTCLLDTRDCTTGPSCGNGAVEVGEQCDGDGLVGQNCVDLGFSSGTLACNATTCRLDTSGCVLEPPPNCTNECIDANCQEAISACGAAAGCQEVLDCLDSCRDTPTIDCTLTCVPDLNAAAIAIIASDCVQDCALTCQ